MIAVRGLTKLYEKHLAVDRLSFSLPAGSICGLVGPNGAGKTTTMRCIAGLVPATDGAVEVGGLGLTESPIDVKRTLAYVPDDPPLFDDLSVIEHMHFIGKLYRVDDYASKSDDLLNQFELGMKRNAGATTLSRGMRQKLAIACVYLHNPKLMLLDEPLTGLDPPGIRQLLDSIVERASQGATIVLSSHLLAMIEEICTDVMILQEGRSRFFGKKSELQERYSDSLEAAYFAASSAKIPNAWASVE